MPSSLHVSVVRVAALVALCLLLWRPLSTHAQDPRPAVETSLTYTGELVGVPAGGLDQGVRYLDNVDVTTTLRADSVIGGAGLTAFAYGLGTQGGNPSELVGDAQITSNIEAPLSWRLYEAWVQQEVGTRASLLVGLYDLNAEFDLNRTGQLFLNSSHGIGAAFGTSGRNGPSIFPVTSLAARVRVRPVSHTYVQAAIMDGVPGCPSDPAGTVVRFDEGEGVLAAGELGVYLGSDSKAGAIVDRSVPVRSRGKLAVGGWIYSSELPEWSTVNAQGMVERSPGSRGLYLLAEGQVYSETRVGEQGLSSFARLGWADDRHNRFGGYMGGGLVYTGLIPAREQDEAGIAIAAAWNGDAYRAAKRRVGQPTTDAEVSIEGTYSAPLLSWLTVKADVQYVVNPNTSPTIPDAIVSAFRVSVNL